MAAYYLGFEFQLCQCQEAENQDEMQEQLGCGGIGALAGQEVCNAASGEVDTVTCPEGARGCNLEGQPMHSVQVQTAEPAAAASNDYQAELTKSGIQKAAPGQRKVLRKGAKLVAPRRAARAGRATLRGVRSRGARHAARAGHMGRPGAARVAGGAHVLLVAIFVYLAFAPTADDPPEQPALQAALRTALPRPERWAQAARRVLNQPAQGSAEWIFCAPQWQELPLPGEDPLGQQDQVAGDPRRPVHGRGQSQVRHIEPAGRHRPRGRPEALPVPGRPGSINPGLLPRQGAEVASGLQAASCEIFEAGAWQGFRAAAVQWEAVQPLCQPKLWETQGLAEAGPKALDGALVQHLLKDAWVDPRFVGNYVRLYNASGWIPRAFVNYYSGATGGKIQRMTEDTLQKRLSHVPPSPPPSFQRGFCPPPVEHYSSFPWYPSCCPAFPALCRIIFCLKLTIDIWRGSCWITFH
ncbi:unnamed protein product [Prorocentrum cordatum]|uniref:Uncharacterized protein n=1 Tax=Prorocentrum cordatum TaxID=2364126 RepID=A0ABN9UQ77_9DINO|nr:unnamed protein product [Polarella glacialis]